MSKALLVKIITPEKLEYERNIKSATFPTDKGEITILPDHQDIIVAIVQGELRVQDEKGETDIFWVESGIAKMSENILTVLLDSMENVKNIDIDIVADALERAEDLKNKTLKQDVEFARFEAEFEKEMWKMRIARKYKR